MKRTAWLLVASLALAGCGGGDDEQRGGGSTGGKDTPTGAVPIRADGSVREPAVAGLWYPKEAESLARMVDVLLNQARAGVPGKVRAIISPHAGYRYSGLTAAVAYKQLMGANVATVIVLAPSHYAAFEGASIPPVEAYRTPLGLIRVSPSAAELARTPPFVAGATCQVRRPDGFRNFSKVAPPFGEDTPHTWEHSVESQLPFLQRALKDFEIIPVVYGQVDPAVVAQRLTKYIDDRTVLVASSDLSHYHPYEEAKSLDAWCVKAVREMDLKTMAQQEACGKGPILTVMHLAKERGWKPMVLNYTNSGDVPPPAGNKKRVVGYMGAVFVEEGKVDDEPLTAAERQMLLSLARRSATAASEAVAAALKNNPKAGETIQIALPKVDRASLPSSLLKPKGCFVTLNKDGKLRGCIGYTMAIKPLYEAVIEMAANAAIRDARFKPVRPDELGSIEVDISVLTVPREIYYNTPSDLLKRLRPGVDGVVLRVGRRSAVYLPSVWKQIPEPNRFMQNLSRKAGLSADAWRRADAKILTFQAKEHFTEPKG